MDYDYLTWLELISFDSIHALTHIHMYTHKQELPDCQWEKNTVLVGLFAG